VTQLAAFAAGLLFAIGLGLAGMTDPANVTGFLDLTGDFRPALLLVMVGGIGVHAVTRRLALRRAQPLFAPHFPTDIPTKVTGRLVVGAALFGVGWGLSGFCPGPAVVAIVASKGAALFVAAMLGGLSLGGLLLPGGEVERERPSP
jgi:uncharacterized membrane protein YedE/YeeE